MTRRRKPSPSSPAEPRSAPGQGGNPRPNGYDDPRQLELELRKFVARGQRARQALDEELSKVFPEYADQLQQELEADAARARRRHTKHQRGHNG